jgi:hypothetical protein
MERYIAEAWSAIWPVLILIRGWLTSWWGLRIEVILAALIVLGLSFWIARQQNAALKKDYEEYKPRGREPDDPDKLRAKIQEIEARKATFAWQSVRQALAVGFFGFVVPSSLMALGLLYYSWFVTNGSALARAIGCGGSHEVLPLNLVTAALFVLSQFFMGYGQHLDELSTRIPALSSAASLTPTNSYIVLAVVAYRFYVGAFSLLFSNLVRRAVVAVRSIGPKQKRLVDKLARATSA